MEKEIRLSSVVKRLVPLNSSGFINSCIFMHITWRFYLLRRLARLHQHIIQELIHSLWTVICLTLVILEPAVSTVTIPVAIDSFGVR